MEKTKLFEARTEPEVPLVSKRGRRVIHFDLFDQSLLDLFHRGKRIYRSFFLLIQGKVVDWS